MFSATRQPAGLKEEEEPHRELKAKPHKSVDEPEDKKEEYDEDDDDEEKATVDVTKPVPEPEEEASKSEPAGQTLKIL